MQPEQKDAPAGVTLNIVIRAGEADIPTYEDVVGRHLVRFGERDALHVQWTRADGGPGTAQG